MVGARSALERRDDVVGNRTNVNCLHSTMLAHAGASVKTATPPPPSASAPLRRGR